MTDAECIAHGPPCMDAVCINQRCQYTPQHEGNTCGNDNDWCMIQTTCTENGVCGNGRPRHCPSNATTVSYCLNDLEDPSTGSCITIDISGGAGGACETVIDCEALGEAPNCRR